MTAAGTLTWAAGDASRTTIRLAPVDDMVLEGEERFQIRLRDPPVARDSAFPRST